MSFRLVLNSVTLNDLERHNFELIFARSTSAVTPSEKSSINTNRKSNSM